MARYLCASVVNRAAPRRSLSPTPATFLIGNVTGQTSVDGKSKGTFGADYGDTRLQTNPLEQTFVTALIRPIS